MIFDGDCSFCKYWISYWQNLSGEQIDFQAYQEVSSRFPDIHIQYFKEASRFIESDGGVYGGPDSAYRSLFAIGRLKSLHRWYSKWAWFRSISDHLYNLIAHNRGFFFKLSKLLYGSDPTNLKPFWAIYLFIILFLLLS